MLLVGVDILKCSALHTASAEVGLSCKWSSCKFSTQTFADTKHPVESVLPVHNIWTHVAMNRGSSNVS